MFHCSLFDISSSRGYPAMCKWAASDDDFFLLRRFGEIGARVLLRLQDRIVKLEEDLQHMDHMCLKEGLDNGTFRFDRNFERQRLLDELTSRLEQYRRFYHFQQDADRRENFALTLIREASARSCKDQGSP